MLIIIPQPTVVQVIRIRFKDDPEKKIDPSIRDNILNDLADGRPVALNEGLIDTVRVGVVGEGETADFQYDSYDPNE